MKPENISQWVISMAETHAEDFRDDFPEWLSENHHIYLDFERHAQFIASKRNHYSARTIVEVMRHNSVISERGGKFKINNNRTPDLARLFCLLHPEKEGFFNLRDSDSRLGLAA